MIGANGMNTTTKTEPETPCLLLTPRDAAKSLSICERRLYGLTKAGELPVVRIGRAVRYGVEDLKAWIEKQSSETS